MFKSSQIKKSGPRPASFALFSTSPNLKACHQKSSKRKRNLTQRQYNTKPLCKGLSTMYLSKSFLSFFSLTQLFLGSSSFASAPDLYRKGARIHSDSGIRSQRNVERHAAVSTEAASDASFEDAQKIGRDLAKILSESCSNGEPMPEEATTLLRALISTTSGARGWFVSLLTTPEFEPVFSPPIDESFLTALCDNPEPNIQLMTMNVAMPTATELTHISMGNEDLAEGSRMTARRATVLVEELLDRLPGLRESFEALLSAVDEEREEEGDKEWIKFCKKWGYGPEHKDAIKKKVGSILTREKVELTKE